MTSIHDILFPMKDNSNTQKYFSINGSLHTIRPYIFVATNKHIRSWKIKCNTV